MFPIILVSEVTSELSQAHWLKFSKWKGSPPFSCILPSSYSQRDGSPRERFMVFRIDRFRNRSTFCNLKNNFAELESWVPAPVWQRTMLGPVWELRYSPWLQWEPEPTEVFLSRSLFYPFPWSSWKWTQIALWPHGCPGHLMAPVNLKWKANKETRKAENNAHWLKARFIVLISRPLGQNNINKYHV